MTSPNRCLLLLVDGLRPDVGEAMLAAGDLPNLAAMVDEGGRNRAITVFPSTTSVAYLPFLTGCGPGLCNIPSIRWLDRHAYGGRWWREREAVRSYCGYQAPRLDGDIAPHVRTIFELVPESLGIFTPIARGLTPARDPSRRERQFWGALAHYALWHQPSDDAVSRHLLKAVDGDWRFVFAQFPAVDGYTHQTAPDAEPVRRALRRFDDTVGVVRDRLRRRGELETTLMLMVSDHGATSVHTHLDLAAWFRSQGVPTLSHPVVWERNPRAAVMVAGNGSAMVYARPADRRDRRWPIERLRRPEAFGVPHDVIAALLKEPAVALVAAEARDGGVWVASASGSARIISSNGQVTYVPLDGDPLGVGAARTTTPRGWLDATWDSEYPDAVFHLLDQFRGDRAGDLVVIAREGYDFRERFEVPEHKAGHGSLIRAHMQTPVWASQPVPATPLRTVDLFSAMLDWLEVEVPAGIDGEPVWLPRSSPRPGVSMSRETPDHLPGGSDAVAVGERDADRRAHVGSSDRCDRLSSCLRSGLRKRTAEPSGGGPASSRWARRFLPHSRARSSRRVPAARHAPRQFLVQRRARRADTPRAAGSAEGRAKDTMKDVEARRINVFFYGLFMDAEALREKGLTPLNVRPARVRGMSLRIGKRAALIASPTDSTYGFVIELTHAEIDQLYSEPGVVVYRPEAVTADLNDGSSIAALCFNLPAAPRSDERNPEYAATLRELAGRLGLPGEYVDTLW